jgi:hypothetical protein
MNIAILGTGNVGGTLGKKWTAAGHAVVFGVRDPNSAKSQALLESFPAARLDAIPNALANADVVLLAVPWGAVPEVVQANAGALAGRIVIDATNNFGGPVVNNVQAIAAAVPTVSLFRAFNSLGWEVFDQPQFGATQVDMFYCGPEGDARAAVEQLIQDVGLRAIWLGGLEMVSTVDALGTLWVTLAFRRGWGRGAALKLLTR